MQFSIFLQFPPLETVKGGTHSCGCCYAAVLATSLYLMYLVPLSPRHFAGIRVTSVSEQILQQPR